MQAAAAYFASHALLEASYKEMDELQRELASEEAAAEMRINCTGCGAQLDLDYTFCHKCAAPAHSLATASTAPCAQLLGGCTRLGVEAQFCAACARPLPPPDTGPLAAIWHTLVERAENETKQSARYQAAETGTPIEFFYQNPMWMAVHCQGAAPWCPW